MLLILALASLSRGCVARDAPFGDINAKFGSIHKRMDHLQSSLDEIRPASRSTNQVALRFNAALDTLSHRIDAVAAFTTRILGPVAAALTTIDAVVKQVQFVRDANQAGAAMLAEADKWRPIVNALKTVMVEALQQAASNAQKMKEQATHLYAIKPSEAENLMQQAQEEFDKVLEDVESKSLEYLAQPVREMESCSSKGLTRQTEYSSKWAVSQWWGSTEHTRQMMDLHKCVTDCVAIMNLGVGVYNADVSQKIKAVAGDTRLAVWGLSGQMAEAREEVIRATAITHDLIDGHLTDMTNSMNSATSTVLTKIQDLWAAKEASLETKHETQIAALTKLGETMGNGLDGLAADMQASFATQDAALTGVHGDLQARMKRQEKEIKKSLGKGFTDLTANMQSRFDAQKLATDAVAGTVRNVQADLRDGFHRQEFAINGVHSTLERTHSEIKDQITFAREGLDRQGARLDDIKGDVSYTRGYLEAAHRDTHMGVEGVREELTRLHEKVAVLMRHDCDDKHRELLNQNQKKDAEIEDLKEQLRTTLQKMHLKDDAWKERVADLDGKMQQVTQLHKMDRDRMQRTSRGNAILACITLFSVTTSCYFRMWKVAGGAFLCMCVVACFFSMSSFSPWSADGFILSTVLTMLTCWFSTLAMRQ